MPEVSVTTPKYRRCFDPRFVSEITIADLESPKRARIILNLVRETDRKKSKLIKSLQDQNQKLVKRIASLTQIISDLRAEMMCAEAGNAATVI